ncbi:MAG TPA: 7,8-didemethyl-8-hydroxy-5-deazariboflavin synthase subunit CofG, partial [Thermoleophilaceae bacterium]
MSGQSAQSARRRVTFSRNVTLSLSRTCRCFCKYCAFATHRPHLHAPDEVERLLDDAARRRVKELLVLTGEAPDHNAGVRERLAEWGHKDFTGYVVWACQRALERGLLPHTNLGVLDARDLARLREVTASQGLMLESVNPDLVAHQGSPTKHPEERLRTIRAAGELRIPFTSGILVGIGESEDDRMASLEALAAVHERHGHLQEVILQNFVPHRRYYGEEPAEIAGDAAEAFWRTGLSDAPHRDLPAWATPIDIEDMKRLVAETRRLMPDVGVQVPPNLADWWPELVAAGATDLGGLSANGDHISPEHPFPSPHQVRKRLAADGVALTERLCVYPKYIDADWVAQGVLDVIKAKYWSFIPRRGSGRTDAPFAIRSDLVGPATARARDGAALSAEELTALFACTDAGAIEEMRAAADELRAELAGDTVTFVVNRNINVSNICIVGCAFCGFGQGKRSPDAYEHDREEFVR